MLIANVDRVSLLSPASEGIPLQIAAFVKAFSTDGVINDADFFWLPVVIQINEGDTEEQLKNSIRLAIAAYYQVNVADMRVI